MTARQRDLAITTLIAIVLMLLVLGASALAVDAPGVDSAAAATTQAQRLGAVDTFIGPWEGRVGTCSGGRIGTTLLTAKHCEHWMNSNDGWVEHEWADVIWKGDEPDWADPQLGDEVHGVSYPKGVRTEWTGVVVRFGTNPVPAQQYYAVVHSDVDFCIGGASGTIVLNVHQQVIGVLDRQESVNDCQVDVPFP